MTGRPPMLTGPARHAVAGRAARVEVAHGGLPVADRRHQRCA